MDWRNRISKLWGRMTKEKWIALLAIGAILMILAVPLPGGEKTGGKQTKADRQFPAVFTRAREAIRTREAGRQGEKPEAERGKEPERGSQRPGIPTKRPLKSELKGFFSPWTVLERWM